MHSLADTANSDFGGTNLERPDDTRGPTPDHATPPRPRGCSLVRHEKRGAHPVYMPEELTRGVLSSGDCDCPSPAPWTGMRSTMTSLAPVIVVSLLAACRDFSMTAS